MGGSTFRSPSADRMTSMSRATFSVVIDLASTGSFSAHVRGRSPSAVAELLNRSSVALRTVAGECSLYPAPGQRIFSL
ncbi:hypothetical protein AB0K15_46350 [Amycolatopsis sp. NPDC049253]|uniref:hypothetical protein n=1 Tax=Amycolatopsis sp. NPDC049253 TaxID=3155274 RepID=UPI0034378F66